MNKGKRMNISEFLRVLFPWWQQPQKKGEDQEWQNDPCSSHKRPFRADQLKLEARKTVKAFGEELTSDHDIPPHEENARQNQQAHSKIKVFPDILLRPVNLKHPQGNQRDKRAKEDLHNEERDVQFAGDQQGYDLKRFLRLIDPVYLIKGLQCEVEDQDEE